MIDVGDLFEIFGNKYLIQNTKKFKVFLSKVINLVHTSIYIYLWWDACFQYALINHTHSEISV